MEQNVTYASGLAALGGCLQVLAILILAYPEFQKTQHNIKYSERFEQILVPLNILCQIAVGLVNTVSTWYGPVSIVIPIRVSAQLIFNMLFFGKLGIENFPKDVRVGTYIVVSGALILPIVGPTAQQGQNVVELLEQPLSEFWTMILFSLTAVSGFYCMRFIATKSNGKKKLEHPYKFVILLTARVTSAVLSTSISKFLVGTSGIGLLITICAFLACSVVITCVAILQATEVDQSVVSLQQVFILNPSFFTLTHRLFHSSCR